jgi:hypothetical protein
MRYFTQRGSRSVSRIISAIEMVSAVRGTPCASTRLGPGTGRTCCH